jgi:hypothetical protein
MATRAPTKAKQLTNSEEQCHATATAARATSLPRPAGAPATGTTLAAAAEEHTKQVNTNL